MPEYQQNLTVYAGVKAGTSQAYSFSGEVRSTKSLSAMSRNNFSGSGLDSPNSTGTKCQPVPLQRGQESFSCRHRTSPARNGPYCPGEGVARLTSSFNATSLPVRYKGYPAAVWDVRPPSRDAPPHSRAPEPGFRSAPAPSYPEYDCFRSLVTAWHPLPLVPLGLSFAPTDLRAPPIGLFQSNPY